MFIGRSYELGLLEALKRKGSASMVVIKGRRRIGKSRLASEFGKRYAFYAFTGFPPTTSTTSEEQRRNFALQLEKYFHVPLRYDSWYELFTFLARQVKEQDAVVLLDEISWIGSMDNSFLGALKSVWDQGFSRNPKLILIICGSASFWIEKNIVSSTGFVGRISLQILLKELSLKESSKFWAEAKTSAHEILKVLSVTGGVPKYLEEVNVKESATNNIHNLCFTPSGILFNEFNQIFSDLFDKRQDLYKRIVLGLTDGSKERADLAKDVDLPPNGAFTNYLEDLTQAEFIGRNYTWNLAQESNARSLLSQYRISDNYLRFYLKYILPNSNRIEKGDFKSIALDALPQWTSIMGLQFENLVIHNRATILEALGINPQTVSNDGPYFQRKTIRCQGCQIDYLVQTTLNELYVVEIKFSKHELRKDIIEEVRDKIARLVIPKRCVVRPVLIHVNGVSEDVEDAKFFFKTIDLSELVIPF